ncbi:MAG: redox-sensing transcriptional repressor Rex [Lachnospiraceae bacterium]|jgi:redox-sensing transcriptional repressor|nr:redox-sensing transcriptional repressor Rex [Lachnospiraceae bacterium]
MKKKISQVVIKRMPRYYRYLSELLEQGTERISSAELSEIMNVTASQIRQDLNNFGGFGQQGYGYNVQYLHDEIGKILGLDQTHNLIIIGGGNLGHALASHTTFNKHGFYVKGIFDINPDIQGQVVNGAKIMPMSELDDFVKNNKVDIVALTIPKEHVQEAADHVMDLGVKALWNFANVDLDHKEEVVVQDVHLSDSLMRLTLNMIQNQTN